MGRPREFDESQALDAAMQCFWAHGFEATSVRQLADRMGITLASLYNAFGDKRALFRRALDHYLDRSVRERIGRLAKLPPRIAIAAYFEEIIARTLADRERRGCMLVNCALELAPHDTEFRRAIAAELTEIETFFRRCVESGQAGGSIARILPADDLARHLLSVVLGLRVLARARPDRTLLEGVVRPALALLDVSSKTKEPTSDDRPVLLADAKRPQDHDVPGGGRTRLPHQSGGHQRRRPVQAGLPGDLAEQSDARDHRP